MKEAVVGNGDDNKLPEKYRIKGFSTPWSKFLHGVEEMICNPISPLLAGDSAVFSSVLHAAIGVSCRFCQHLLPTLHTFYIHRVC